MKTLVARTFLRLAALALLIFFLAAGVSQAQTPGYIAPGRGNCGNGLPCGPVPWNLPALPNLDSPTPMPTFFLTATPSPTMTPTNFTPSPTPTATNTPTATFTPSSTPTETPFFDADELLDHIATLENIIDATPMIVDINGTPVIVSTQIAATGADIETFFGHVKGILGADWGPFTPPFQAFIVVVGVTFTITVLVIFTPVIGFLFGLIRKIYHAIMEFVPL